ncbi:MAG: glycosyltransferase family 4 protein [Daejeonella sp.]
MNERLTIYIVGDFRSGAADGLAEFNYQNVKLLEDTFLFEFIEFNRAHSTDYYRKETREGIEVHCFGIQGLHVYKLSSLFRDWLAGLSANNMIFHLSHIWNINNYLIARQLVKLNIRYLITPHDSYVYGRLYNKSKPFLKRLYRKAFVRIFDKYVLDHAQIVHALTAQCVPSLRSITSSKISVVENQVKDVGISSTFSQIKPQVCYIGRLSIFQKGVDLALAAFAHFKSTYRSAASYILVGPAEKEASEACGLICENSGLTLDADVVLTGKLPEKERNTVLAESKVYLQLSRYEGFGLSVVQALSAFKPVVVSTGIPIGGVILDYKAGFVAHNTQEASEALKKLFSMPADAYEEMAKNARQCYEKEFHPDVIKPKLIELYESVVSK